MNTSLVLQNVLTPPVLFFFLGALAVLLKSNLEIPSPLPKLFSLYLLLAIGFKGGLGSIRGDSGGVSAARRRTKAAEGDDFQSRQRFR